MNNSIEVNQWIRNRRSLFPLQFDETKKIKPDVILSILENANHAPSHKRTEPWRFIVFSEEALEQLFEEQIRIYKHITPSEEFSEVKVKKMQMKARKVSHAIAIIVSYDEQQQVPKFEEEWAVACAVQNIYLSCESHGVGGYWGTGSLVLGVDFKHYLNLKENENCMGLFQLGIPLENLNLLDKNPLTDISHKIEWR
ncbi:nitroreductase family protein [Acidiluteibacter ferrifornacis]|uniref:Nitroreductase n=1 Tax=Acidiluteibacter ferrifornacis TaxID=2692424 RepID=A0A6N9NNM4_9FLAO|nr:nitroreductase [Acidiluteibacter ferrifornacis]NBG67469.1 nitroreductase [Acidiluteibacter ferrifornacis]